MLKIVDIPYLVAFLAFGMFLEFLRATYAVPITVLDIILAPISLVALYFSLRYVVQFFSGLKNTGDSQLRVIPWQKRLGYSLFSVLMFGMGVWGTLDGFANPLLLYTGVKGAVHGYSLALVGMLIAIWSVYLFYVFAFKGKGLNY